jgi:hypothetical protein
MPNISEEILARFFERHLPFCPTPKQVADFEADLSLVSPFLMEASLMEVRAGTQGYMLVYRPNEWRPAIFSVYNRKVAEHAQLFPIFHCFEIAFRSTVAVTLEQHYAHSRWWVAVYKAVKAGRSPKSVGQVGGVPMSRHAAFRIGRIVQDIDGEDLSRGIIPRLKNGFEFMEHCDLAHIRQLIREHWGAFTSRFQRLKQAPLNDFEAKFERIREARNTVYHHRSLSGMSSVVIAAEELLDRLDFSLGFVCGKIGESTPKKATFSIAIEPRHRTW